MFTSSILFTNVCEQCKRINRIKFTPIVYVKILMKYSFFNICKQCKQKLYINKKIGILGSNNI